MSKKLRENYIFKGHILNLRIDDVLIKDKECTREIIEHDDAVAVVAVDNEGYMYFVKQYRYPVEDYVLEIPAGLVEKNENYKEAAIRELQEEIGFSAKNIEKLYEGYTSPGFCTEKIVIYKATDLFESKLPEDDDEEIEIVKIHKNNLKEMLNSGKFNDFKTIIGILNVIND